MGALGGSCLLGCSNRLGTGALCGSRPLGHPDKYRTLTFFDLRLDAASSRPDGIQGNRLC
jgi:hypothetical protein